MKKVVVCLKGGLGNQLFQYAAGRRLAYVNNAELMIDTSYFKRDFVYKRKYLLDNFKINAKRYTFFERLGPFEKYARFAFRKLSRLLPFEKRVYIEQEKLDFDPRLLNLKIKKILYLDGYWQSENYFKDIEDIIRSELQIKFLPTDHVNREMVKKIRNCNSVAIHVRFFDKVGKRENRNNNLSKEYYIRAIKYIESKISNVHYFIFSDIPEKVLSYIVFPKEKITLVDHNKEEENSYIDLWLMSQCKHFIIANSTFSWWGAWLSKNKGKIVIAPKFQKIGIGAWGFRGLIPEEWIAL